MPENGVIEQFNGEDGEIVAEIVQDENGNYDLWKIDRPNNSCIGNYHDLAAARAEAQMIVIRYNQDRAKG